jgi:ubiquinone/menaquinone biosynthesis C-methylase UbiE
MKERLPAPRCAIDLACGTGLSTRPLAAFAGRVIGVDVSLDMLAATGNDDTMSFVAGEIEHLPFADRSFDLATVASAIHWLRAEGVSEIARILAPSSPLVVYDVWFPAEIVGAPGFLTWLSDLSEARYPSVPKRHENLDLLKQLGFESLWTASDRERVRMTPDELADYLMTHSERIAAIRSGRETEEQQFALLRSGIEPFFSRVVDRDVVFGIEIQVFRSS